MLILRHIYWGKQFNACNIGVVTTLGVLNGNLKYHFNQEQKVMPEYKLENTFRNSQRLLCPRQNCEYFISLVSSLYPYFTHSGSTEEISALPHSCWGHIVCPLQKGYGMRQLPTYFYLSASNG